MNQPSRTSLSFSLSSEPASVTQSKWTGSHNEHLALNRTIANSISPEAARVRWYLLPPRSAVDRSPTKRFPGEADTVAPTLPTYTRAAAHLQPSK
ncbi:hypothetical protein E2C01_060343 [Portunus trituberculatus]|uniref:Uncharacterized protein n=1 Tax=Portunus trituberculatus TaxID=210409 RepID=A0A5B7HA75_PORTR|nr:hypothetical protein [Portunus trituberculatus]